MSDVQCKRNDQTKLLLDAKRLRTVGWRKKSSRQVVEEREERRRRERRRIETKSKRRPKCGEHIYCSVEIKRAGW